MMLFSCSCAEQLIAICWWRWVIFRLVIRAAVVGDNAPQDIVHLVHDEGWATPLPFVAYRYLV